MIVQIKVQKGGVGKSFITANLAHLYSRQDKTVILTTDTQNSILDFFTKENDVTTIEGLITSINTGKIKSINLRANLDYIPLEHEIDCNFEEIKNLIFQLQEHYKYILIDSTPTLNTKLDKILLELSDEIIIPVFPDKLTINGVVNILVEHKNKIKAIIFNKYSDNLKIHKFYYDTIKEACLETDIMVRKIPNWQYISELVEKGKTIWESKCKKEKLERIKRVFIDLIKS